MRINVEATRKDCEPALLWLAGHVGGPLRQRVKNFDKHTSNNPMLAAHFRSTYSLEYALVDACKYRRSRGRAPIGGDYDALYNFAIPAMRMYQQLPESGRRPFEGKLQDFVNGTYGSRPFAYEIGIATHLMQMGWDVEFSDLCGTARFDFLARADGNEIEVECKTTSGDTGRKIHRQEVNRLADMLIPVTEQLVDVAGCHLLRITVLDRLGKTTKELSELVELVRSGIDKGEQIHETGTVIYSKEAVTGWPEPQDDLDGARQFFERLLGGHNSHLFFQTRRGHSIVAARVASKKPDKVVGSLSNDAVDAAKQCSGTRPALVAMQLIDPIEPEELHTMMHTPNGLHKIAHAVFKNEARAHVDSIVFSTPQKFTMNGPNDRRMSAHVLVLNNNKAKFPTDAPRSVFRTPGRRQA
jgi:hypothetical protein